MYTCKLNIKIEQYQYSSFQVITSKNNCLFDLFCNRLVIPILGLYINRILYNAFFGSLRETLYLRFTYVPCTNNLPFYSCILLDYMNKPFPFCYWRTFGLFPDSAIVYRAAIILVQVFWWAYFHFFCIYTQDERCWILDLSCLPLVETAEWLSTFFPIMIPTCTPTSNIQECQLLCILTDNWHC